MLYLVEYYGTQARKEAEKYPDLIANPGSEGVSLKGVDDDYDAFRHIYSSAAVTYDLGILVALTADMREGGQKEHDKMDLHNNALGRNIGLSVKNREEISFETYRAIKENRHIRLVPPQIGTHGSPKEDRKNYYIWRTQQDGHVRAEHAARDGHLFAWNKSPPDGHPGEAHGCRCVAEPVAEGTAAPAGLAILFRSNQVWVD